MLPSRKKFRFDVPPTDRQIWAIGMVTVQWSALEMWTRSFVHALNGQDAEAIKRFDETLVSKQRYRQFRNAVLQKVKPAYQHALLAIIDRITGLQQERDRIVHGAWGDTGPETPISVFHFGKPRKPFDWRLNFGQIVDVALKIERLSCDLVDYAMKHLPKPTPAQFSFADALQYILNKPEPRP